MVHRQPKAVFNSFIFGVMW